MNSILGEAERLATQCRATSDSHAGSQLRTEKILMEHRQLVFMLEQMLEYQHGYARIHLTLSRLVKKMLDAFSTGSNGHRTWVRGIHPAGKTALVLIQQFLQRHR